MQLFKTSPEDSWRLQLFEFIATPAHLFLRSIAFLLGVKFSYGPTESEEGEENQKEEPKE